MDGCRSVVGGGGLFFTRWFGVKEGVPAAWNLCPQSVTTQYFSELVEGVADLAA